MKIDHGSHPLLDAICLLTDLDPCVEQWTTPAPIKALFDLSATAPFTPTAEIKTALRKLLRHGRFKAKGRSKPAAEALWQAVEAGRSSVDRGINLVVDLANAVSLRSGLAVSVLDYDLIEAPFRFGVCAVGSHYVFNPSGQSLDLGDLLAFHDKQGPCGTAVKDAQRSKIHGHSKSFLSIIWGTKALPGYTEKVAAWYRQLWRDLGVETLSLEAHFTKD